MNYLKNTIIINFNVTMEESSVESSIELDPWFEHSLLWNDDSNSLLITPVLNFTSGTVYQIIYDDTGKAFYNDSTLSSGVISFTTEG